MLVTTMTLIYCYPGSLMKYYECSESLLDDTEWSTYVYGLATLSNITLSLSHCLVHVTHYTLTSTHELDNYE